MKSKLLQNTKAGVYLRLSNDDERTGESLLIENQRRILVNMCGAYLGTEKIVVINVGGERDLGNGWYLYNILGYRRLYICL